MRKVSTMDKIKVTVWTQHAATPGTDAYEAEAFTAEFSLDGHADHAHLAAAAVIAGLVPMYRGDRIRMEAAMPGRGYDRLYGFLGVAGGSNEDQDTGGDLDWIARQVER